VNSLVPIWIIGGPFVGLVILAFSFRGPSTVTGATRLSPADRQPIPSAPLLDPMHPDAPRRRI
jgi:hypothetical protein